MEQAELRFWEQKCTQEDWPECQAACPIHVDVRSFVAAMHKEDFRVARQILEKQMPFPALLSLLCDHPCENRCLRKDLGGSVAISALERSCFAAEIKPARTLPRPRKSSAVLVAGAGLAGLTVAWDLAGKGYPVYLVHSTQEPMDFVRGEEYGEIAPAVLDTVQQQCRDRGIVFIRDAGGAFDKEALQRFIASGVANGETQFAVRANGADILVSGVCVDVSCYGDLAPQVEQVDPLTGTADAWGYVTYAGYPALWRRAECNGDSSLRQQAPGTASYSAPIIESVSEGRRAAVTLDRFIMGASLEASREREGSCSTQLFTSLARVAPLSRTTLDATGMLPKEDVSAEAGRCLQCMCLECVKHCAYLSHYKGYPRTYARQIYNNAAIVKGVHQANTMINSCTLCGQCAELCPNDFSMADLCLAAREHMVARNVMPPSAHAFALQDMAVSNGPDCALALADPAHCGIAGGKAVVQKSSAHVFFPGCQLSAARSKAVVSVFDHLHLTLPDGVGIWLGCCSIPEHWAGRAGDFAKSCEAMQRQWEDLGKPRVIVACSSCLSVFRQHLPSVPVVSLWQVLAEESPLPEARPFLNPLCIHDPCTARHDEEWQHAVRTLLGRLRVDVIEPEQTGRTTPCCGYGGLVSSAHPGMAAQIAAHRVEEIHQAAVAANKDNVPAVASCIMCRHNLAKGNLPAYHLLDLLLPDSAEDLDPCQPDIGLSERRMNRAFLKRELLRQNYGVDVLEPEPILAGAVHFDEGVVAAMEKRFILTEDVAQVLRHVSAGGQIFRDAATGHFLACFRPGWVTFWVRYSKDDAGYLVHDAYCHRMEVPMDTGSRPETLG